LVKTNLKEKFRNLLGSVLRNESAPIFFVFIAIIIIIDIIQPRFLSPMNIRNIFMQVSITAITALGMTFVMVSGGIDLSVGWMISFLGCLMAHLIALTEIPIFFVVMLIVVITVISSGLMGFIISRTKLEPFIVSLGFMSMYQGFTYLISKGSERSIGEEFKFLGGTFPLGIGMPIYVFLILAVVLGLVLKYTKFGRRVYAVGGNQEAAYLAGIDVKNFKMIIYILNGLLLSIASMTLMSRLHSGNPLMGTGKEIDAIAAVVVGGTALSGGRGSIFGTVIGVLLLGIISNGMNIIGINPYWQFVFKGVVIVASVLISYYSGLKASSSIIKRGD
jgi:ribose/xylose/arabinose/galactoside ABC-type transport system permease subunit